MQDGENINDEFLRTLDNRAGPNDTHVLIVTTGSFGMRGFDYRSQSKGITLIIAASFSNQRQAMQGLCRVGRFGDKCKRYITNDISLIDKNEELLYIASLMKFLSANQKNKIIQKLAPEERKKSATDTNTRNNTAKSTSTIGKSKNEWQQSSQTGIPPLKSYTKRQILLPPILTTDSKKREEKEEIVITESQLL